ncbi:TonB-dependent siderophore receptor [Pseudothauera nasutitermitis]|uniref:TonB-dependent siderophore receptor n=1 Tax=Pseudothauera nasutitermitis TaxID=2565930 RepID=A0A4S4B5T6_9RHOO|nr:TonB-dependent receptor [Pseudothauera nasutitermitis]THF66337.1 TonB-dependent siderophore receptor [Pseudothauera nasutitermitis]
MTRKHRPSARRPHPLRCAIAVSLALASLTAAAQSTAGPTAVEAAAPRAWDLPSAPLADTLARIARDSGQRLSADPVLISGKTAAPVRGNLSPADAARQALAGTGLELVVTEGGTLSVRPAPVRTKDGEAVLTPMTVTAGAAPSDSPLAYLSKNVTTGALGDRSVLDTPFSITVVSSEEIVTRDARTIGQIFVNDASIYSPTSASTTNWWGTQIRGLRVRNTYIDDIPTMHNYGSDFPTEVVESVTALKGLTGFMYGFGIPGGALSYQLKRAKSTNETEVGVGYRNPRLFSAHADISRRTEDGFGVRVNIATEQGKAYNESRIDRTVGALALDKSLGSALHWFGNVVYEKSRNTGEPMQFYIDNYDAAASAGRLPRPTYRYGDVNIDNAWYETETTLATTGFQWKIDERWRLKYQVGFSRKEHRSNKSFAELLNADGDYAGYGYNYAGKLDNLFTQAMLQGDFVTGPLRHEVVAGLGLQREKVTWSNEWYSDFDFLGNLYQTQTFRTNRTADFSLGPLSSDTRQTYAFVSDTVHFGPHWQAILGLRFTDYRVKDLDDDPSADSGYRTRNVSPTLALIYKPDARTSLYGSFVEGLEAGGRVNAIFVNAGTVLDATVSRQYEVGVKREAGGVDYTAALFRMEHANQIIVWRDGGRYLTQDGLSIYQGAEFSAAWQATRHLNLGLAAVWLDASLDEVSDDNAALRGNRPANAPKWLAVANAQYRVPGVDGLKLHGNVRYHGKSFANDSNTLNVPSRTLVNLGFSQDFRVQGRNWTLHGNVYNLFDKEYWAAGGYGQANLGEERNFSLMLRTRF